MQLNRRTVLGAAAATPLLGTLAMAAQPLSGQQAPAFYRFKVGALEVTAINDGFFRFPVEGFIRNASLDDVKSVLGAAFQPTDQLIIPFTTLVVNTGSKLVLIDTGNGNSGAPTSGSWMTNFKAAGFDPNNVDTILISHFHGDHINGLRLKDGSAVFPKAEVMVPETEWTFWTNPDNANSAPDRVKANFANVKRVFDPIAKDITRFGWGKEPVTGITTIDAHGHTPGHTTFALSSGSGRLLVMSDTTNNPILFARHPEWSAVFDMNGEDAIKTRRKMLDMAATDRMQVSFYHAAFPATGHIAKDGNGFNMVPMAFQPTL